MLSGYTPLMPVEMQLYDQMREAVPVIDAALYKLGRLLGGFKVYCEDPAAQNELNDFIVNVRVGPGMTGLEMFICSFFDNLLMYGNALGEMVLTPDRSGIAALFNASLRDISVKQGETPLDVDFYRQEAGFTHTKIQNPELILFSALNPPDMSIRGVSVLRSLPFVSSILLKIYNSVGQNFERIGNVRFAVTYNPGNEALDKAYAKDRAIQIAKEWSEGMEASRNGQVHDFIAVGDVDIKVIGADNQIIDCEVPARQMLEQIIAKLSIPPFLLGLNWSTTERMSKHQYDILNEEISYYRRLLSPVIIKICRTFLHLSGCVCEPRIEWESLDFQDEIDSARSRLINAQAAKLEQEVNRFE